ncbi:MAG: glycosyltransferase family 39 protein [Desulfitobacteriaceae bacterium]|jgi:4-amino-4-deoxy-L-arabinose transferase-like glycosyltransferase|nr:glycosyltransferase family 39 protein [Desulfitobacteriaceae bacterium]
MFFLALLLRLGTTYVEYANNGTEGWSDAKLYLATGMAFSEGDFFPPDGTRTPYMIIGPGIPLIVAASQLVFGDPIWPVLVLNCLVSALLVFVLYKLGEAIMNRNAGMLLAFWSVFNLSLIRTNYQILKEPYLITLVPLVTLLLVYVSKKRNMLMNTVISSILFSVLIHIDERFLVYLPIVVVTIIISKRVSKRAINALIFIVILLISMIPWTIRNYKQFDELVILTPRTTSFTSKAWGTNWGQNHFEDDSRKESLIQHRIQAAEAAAEEARVELREYGKYEKYLMAFYHYWKPVYLKTNFIQYGFRPVKWSLSHNLSGLLFYGIFLPLYIIGIFVAYIRKHHIMLVLGMIPIFHSLLHTVMIWPLERYRLPMNFLIVLTALWVILEYTQIIRIKLRTS